VVVVVVVVVVVPEAVCRSPPPPHGVLRTGEHSWPRHGGREPSPAAGNDVTRPVGHFRWTSG